MGASENPFSSTPDRVGTPRQLHGFTRQVIRQCLEAAESGPLPLKIPRLRGMMHVVEGMHFHELPEMFIQVSGSSLFMMPEEDFTLQAGEICIMPAGLPHGERTRSKGEPFHNLVFMFRKPFFMYHLAREGQGRQPVGWVQDGIVCPNLNRLTDLMEAMTEVFHAPSAWRERNLRGLLMAHLASLLTQMEQSRDVEAEEETAHPRISQVRKYVLSFFQNPDLTVTQLAEMAHCSPDYLSHLFRMQTGHRLIDYINRQRLTLACHLLETTALTVSEIAYVVGYNAPGYFARLFRREHGQSPRAWRQARAA